MHSFAMSPAPRKKTKIETQRLVALFYPHYPKPSQVKTFYAAMGRTIAAWQYVESQLYEVYRSATGAQVPGAEAAAFFSVPAFRVKLNMTSAAVKFAHYGERILLAEWGTLAKRAQKKSERRNQIAHGAVWTQFLEQREERKIYIGPNLGDPREALEKKPGQDTEPITVKRLRGYEKDFRLLAMDLRAFALRIRRT